MKKLFKMSVALDVYFVAEDQDALNLGLKFWKQEFNIGQPYISETEAVKLTEIKSGSQISEKIDKDDYFLYGTDDNITIHQWLLKAFL